MRRALEQSLNGATVRILQTDHFQLSARLDLERPAELHFRLRVAPQNEFHSLSFHASNARKCYQKQCVCLNACQV